MTDARIELQIARRRWAVLVYRRAVPMPFASWNRYPDRTIGAVFRLPRMRCLSVVWARP
jgi:hypothetical protein